MIIGFEFVLTILFDFSGKLMTFLLLFSISSIQHVFLLIRSYV